MGVHPGRGGDRGGGVKSYGNLHLSKVEYGCAVYFDATYYGPVQGGGQGEGGAVRDVVVAIGRT